MQSKIKTHQDYQQCKNNYDSLKLIKIIHEFVFKSEDQHYKDKADNQAKRNYYNLSQTSTISCQEYFEKVRNIVEFIKSFGGSLSDDMHLKEELPQGATIYSDQEIKEAKERIHNQTVAYGLLVTAD